VAHRGYGKRGRFADDPPVEPVRDRELAVTEGGQAEIRLTVSIGELPYVREIAAERSVRVRVEEVPVRGVLPVVGIAMVILGGTAAVAEVEHLLEVRRGGQIIDLRYGQHHAFYRSHDLQYGFVLIYRDDGTIEIQVLDVPTSLAKVTDAIRNIITDLGRAGIDAAKAAVEEAVGDSGAVSVTYAVVPIVQSTDQGSSSGEPI
jgi:hypothetical protein